MRRLLQFVSADFQGQWDKLRVHPRSAATSRDSSLFLTTLQGLPCAMLGQCGVERLTCGAEWWFNKICGVRIVNLTILSQQLNKAYFRELKRLSTSPSCWSRGTSPKAAAAWQAATRALSAISSAKTIDSVAAVPGSSNHLPWVPLLARTSRAHPSSGAGGTVARWHVWNWQFDDSNCADCASKLLCEQDLKWRGPTSSLKVLGGVLVGMTSGLSALSLQAQNVGHTKCVRTKWKQNINWVPRASSRCPFLDHQCLEGAL